MVCTSSWLCAIAILLAVSVQSQAQRNVAANNSPTTKQPDQIAEEVIVESSLSVHSPQGNKPRQVRDVMYYLVPDLPLIRAKRQHHHGRHGSGGSGLQQQDYGNAQSTAQSDSHSQGFGPNGFNNANALANAQAFQSHGGGVNFGASAANTHTDAFSASPYGGISGSNSNAGSQSYTLPNGEMLNIAFNNALSNTNGNRGQSQGSSVSFSG